MRSTQTTQWTSFPFAGIVIFGSTSVTEPDRGLDAICAGKYGHFDTRRKALHEIETAFVNYLASAWQGDFRHEYQVTNRPVWNAWRANAGQRDAAFWTCKSLEEADCRYSWRPEEEAGSFEVLAGDLQRALKADNEENLRSVCLKIFRWGGVAARRDDRSRMWVEQIDRGPLDQRLNGAVEALLDENDTLARFDGEGVLMNSAMTKIYAACRPDQLMIYDGRVGAALGLIARRFLENEKYRGPVPTELAFAWGAARTPAVNRNPSTEQYVFPRLFGPRADKRHAWQMRQASRLLRETVKQINQSAVTLRNLERALFMIGYDVGHAR